MKLLIKSNNHRRMIAAMVIIFLVAAIEIIYNYQAIVQNTKLIDVSDSIQAFAEDGYEWYEILYTPEESVYIGQIKLTGIFTKDITYGIETVETNSFGKEETRYYSDLINTCFTEFYTDLEKKVTSIKIALMKPEESELIGVFFTNHFDINKYRILFWVVVFTLFYMVFFERRFLKNIEQYFAIFAVLFGILSVVFVQTTRASWDEQIHFRNVYGMACGRNVEWTEAAWDIVNMDTVNCNTKQEFALWHNYVNELGEDKLFTQMKETAVVPYSYVAYIPMAVFLRIGMLLNMPFSMLYEFGKLGNLFLYIFIMYWAIRLAKQKKLLLAFIAMMPTSLFLAASYSYDSVVFSFITLGCVLWINETLFSENGYHPGRIILAILLFTFGSFSKAVYIPVVLLMIFLPQFMKLQKGQRLIFYIGVFAVFTLVVMTFVLPTLSNTVAGNLSFGGDSRGGDTSVTRQLISMIKHPLASIKLMVENVFALDNFRNLGYAEADNFFVGNLMFLNFAILGILSDKWAALFIFVFVLLLFYKDPREPEPKKYSIWLRIGIILVLAMTVFLIWLALYLDFTPVGSEYIAGVQARYYLPLIYLGALLTLNKKIKVHVSYEGMSKLMMITANIFEMILIYDNMLKGRFF